MPKPRVVVTGVGPVTPVGIGVEDFWNGLTSGRNGIAPITAFDTSELPVTLAAEVKDFDPSTYMNPKEVRRTGLFTRYAIAAAALAWEDAGTPQIEGERGGVIFATGIGGIEWILSQHDVIRDKGAKRVSPFMVPALMGNAAAGHIAMTYKLTGPNFCTTSACASGAHGIGEAYRYIRDGYVDLCIAGGSEAATCDLTIAAFSQMTALTKNPDPDTASRPFDAERDGFILGEGACAMVLESEEHAKARGARIYAELAGYGASDDAYHITAPNPDGSGAAIAIRRALTDAGARPEDIDYVNAHGTSTPLNDASETAALKAVLGNGAKAVAVSSTKSMTGHMLGAAGAMEGAITALAVAQDRIPPTIHYATPDPACDLDVTPNEARDLDVNFAISDSFGFGGQNAVLAFRKLAS